MDMGSIRRQGIRQGGAYLVACLSLVIAALLAPRRPFLENVAVQDTAGSAAARSEWPSTVPEAELEEGNVIAVSEDALLVAVGFADGSWVLQDVRSGFATSLREPDGTKSIVAAFSPHGRYLAAALADDSVILWDIRKPNQASTIHVGGVEDLTFSSDGQSLAARTGASEILIYSIPQGRLQRKLTTDMNLTAAGHVVWFPTPRKWTGNSAIYQNSAFLPDRLPVIPSERIHPSLEAQSAPIGSRSGIQSAEDLAQPAPVSHSPALEVDGVEGNLVAVSEDDLLVAVASADGSFLVRNIKSGYERRLQDTSGIAPSVASFSPRGRYLAAALANGTIKVWDLERGYDAFTIHDQTGTVENLIFSLDGRLLAARYESSGIFTYTLEQDYLQRETTADVSPDSSDQDRQHPNSKKWTDDYAIDLEPASPRSSPVIAEAGRSASREAQSVGPSSGQRIYSPRDLALNKLASLSRTQFVRHIIDHEVVVAGDAGRPLAAAGPGSRISQFQASEIQLRINLLTASLSETYHGAPDNSLSLISIYVNPPSPQARHSLNTREYRAYTSPPRLTFEISSNKQQLTTTDRLAFLESDQVTRSDSAFSDRADLPDRSSSRLIWNENVESVTPGDLVGIASPRRQATLARASLAKIFNLLEISNVLGAIAFSLNNSHVSWLSHDGTLYLWEISEEQILWAIPLPTESAIGHWQAHAVEIHKVKNLSYWWDRWELKDSDQVFVLVKVLLENLRSETGTLPVAGIYLRGSRAIYPCIGSVNRGILGEYSHARIVAEAHVEVVEELVFVVPRRAVHGLRLQVLDLPPIEVID